MQTTAMREILSKEFQHGDGAKLLHYIRETSIKQCLWTNTLEK
jgi:hypothetical protein